MKRNKSKAFAAIMNDVDKIVISRMATIPDDNGCIKWLGKYLNNGYGYIYKMVDKIPHQLLAHRVVYCVINNVNIDDIEGKVVMHKCDNPQCVNVDHLMLGTQGDNMRDRHQKGRYNTQASAHDHHCSRFTVDQIKDVITKSNAGMSQKEIAKECNVSQPAICVIVNGQRKYKLTIKPISCKEKMLAKYAEIRELLKTMTYKEIIAEFGYSNVTISRAVKAGKK